MNVSREFQEVESNHSGRLFHVSSQPAMIPSSRSLLSRNKRLPLDTWNQSGLQENVFGNQFSAMVHPEIFLKEFHLITCKETEKQSLKRERRRLFTQVKTDKIKAQFQCRHLRQGRYWWNYRRTTWSDSKDSKYRNCNSANSLIHNRRIKEVEMVDSLDELKSSRSVIGKNFPKIRDAGRDPQTTWRTWT